MGCIYAVVFIPCVPPDMADIRSADLRGQVCLISRPPPNFKMHPIHAETYFALLSCFFTTPPSHHSIDQGVPVPTFSPSRSIYYALGIMPNPLSVIPSTHTPLHPLHPTPFLLRGYLNCPELLAPRAICCTRRIMLPPTPSLIVMKGSRVTCDKAHACLPPSTPLPLAASNLRKCEWKRESVEQLEVTHLFRPFKGT